MTNRFDTRLLANLPTWSGATEYWTEWCFQVRVLFGISHPSVLAFLDTFCETNPTPVEDEMSEEARTRSRELYYLLAYKTTGAAALRVRRLPTGHGYTLWRQWVEEHSRLAEQNALGMLQGILSVKLPVESSLAMKQGLEELDLKLDEYSRHSAQPLQDAVIVATLVKQLPEQLRQHVELNIREVDSYKMLRKIILHFAEVKHEYKPTILPGIGAQESSPTPMEIGALQGFGKDKGKGKKGKGKDHKSSYNATPGYQGASGKGKTNDKGKGKGGKPGSTTTTTQKAAGSNAPGKFNGECGFCGKWGHKRADCWLKQGKQKATTAAVEGVQSSDPTTTATSSQNSTAVAAVMFDISDEDDLVLPDFVLALGQSTAEPSALDPRSRLATLDRSAEPSALDPRSRLAALDRGAEPSALILVDSGSDVHVAPSRWLDQFRRVGAGKLGKHVLYDIAGRKLPSQGERTVLMNLGAVSAVLTFQCSEVRYPVLSACLLSDSGLHVDLEKNKLRCKHSTGIYEVPLERMNNKLAIRISAQWQKKEEKVPLIIAAGSLGSSSSAEHVEEIVRPDEPGVAVAEPLAEENAGDPTVGERVAEGEVAVPEFGLKSRVEDMKERLRALRAPVWGDKRTLLARLPEAEARARQEAEEQRALEARHAARLEGAGATAPLGTRTLPTPDTPTEEEKARHDLTHLPTRPWCEICARGKGRSTPHGQIHPIAYAGRLPVVQLDFIFMSGEVEGGQQVCILTGVDYQTGWPLAAVLPSKAITPYAIELVLEFLDKLAHEKVVLHSDGEVAMKNLLEAVAKKSTKPTLLRYTPRHSPESIGRLAVVQQHLQGQIRTLKLDVESRYGIPIGSSSAIFPWIVRHCAWVIARFHVKLNGQTSYEHAYGTSYTGAVVPILETCLFQHAVSETGHLTKDIRRAKATSTWQRGLWLGKAEKTDEHVVFNGKGLFKTRDLRRLVADSRSDLGLIKSLEVVPWQPVWGEPPGRRTRSAAPVAEPVGLENPSGGLFARRRLEEPGPGPQTPMPVPSTPLPQTPRAPGRGQETVRETPPEADTNPRVDNRKGTQDTGSRGQKRVAVDEPGGATSSSSSSSSDQAMEQEQETVGEGSRPKSPDSRDRPEEEEPESKRLRTVGMIATMDVLEETAGASELFSEAAKVEETKEVGKQTIGAEWGDGPRDPELRERLVREGTTLELQRLKDFEVYEVVRRSTSAEPSARVIKTRWVEGFKRNPDGEWICRRRFVAKDIAFEASWAFFAPTTSTSTSRILDAIASKMQWFHFEADASNAFLHAPVGDADNPIYADPPVEWHEATGISREFCWKVHRALYGLRQAPQAWLRWLSAVLQEEMKFSRCVSEPCFFIRRGGEADSHQEFDSNLAPETIMLEIHMDDVHGICGDKKVIKEFCESLSERVMLKYGGPYGEGQSFIHLRRERQIGKEGTTIKPSRRYLEDVLSALKLNTCKAVATE